IEVPMTECNGMTVHGYIVKPHAGRANRSMQHFFVNGRYVKSRLMQAAMEEAYRNAIITGKYPSGALFLDLPLSAVDVNVHPAKTEVKFSQEKPIFEVVYIACKNALAANDNMPHLEHKEKEAPAKPHEDNLTHEQQRFAIPKPVDPKPFVTPSVKPTPIAPIKNDEEAPDLEDFLVSIRQRQSVRTVHRLSVRVAHTAGGTAGTSSYAMAQPVEPVTEPTPAVHTRLWSGI
ncbi:MAG: hypothetical protein ACLT2F_03415, partial [Butyricicoccus sp.]